MIRALSMIPTLLSRWENYLTSLCQLPLALMSVIFNVGFIIDPTGCCIKPFQDLEQYLTETRRMEESERKKEKEEERK